MAIHGIDTDEALEIDGPEGTLNDGLFTINNGVFISADGSGSAADLKSKAQGTLNNCHFKGYSTFVKIRENYDEANACADKSDAFDNMVSKRTLIISNSNFNGASSLADAVNAYTKVSACASKLDNTKQAAIDAEIAAGANSANTNAAPVMNAFKDWTWASINGKI